MKKILIVEDDLNLKKELNLFLSNNGLEVTELSDFNNPLEDILKNVYDLILLDIKLPNIDGEYLCKELREKITTPIIIVTSKNTEIDEILSINYGADDFITKPYNPQVLLARINRLLNKNINEDIIKYNNLIIDKNKSIIKNSEKSIDLTKNELKIITFLLSNKGKIVSRTSLINYLWDSDEFIDDNTLTVNINRLRNKLYDLCEDEIIVTKRSQGYIIL